MLVKNTGKLLANCALYLCRLIVLVFNDELKP